MKGGLTAEEMRNERFAPIIERAIVKWEQPKVVCRGRYPPCGV